MRFSNLKFASKILRANFNLLRHPYKLIYVVTKECHSRCVHCKIWQTRPQNELSLEEVEKLARNSSFLSWVNFTGGEPTDRPDFPEVVRAFIQSCPDLAFVNFPTNGLNTERILGATERILSYRPPRLMVNVSLDGPPKVNDGLRGIKGDFTSAINTLRELRQLPKLEVVVGMTLYKQNMHLIDETVQAIREHIPDFSERSLHLNIPHTSPHFYGNTDLAPKPDPSLALHLEKALKKRHKSWGSFHFIENQFQKRAQSYIMTGRTAVPCSALKSSVYLSETGEVYPCTIWDQSLGNIRSSRYSLLPLLSPDGKAGPLREQIVKKECPNCWSPCEAAQSIADQVFRI